MNFGALLGEKKMDGRSCGTRDQEIWGTVCLLGENCRKM